MVSILDYSSPEVASEVVSSSIIDSMQNIFNLLVQEYKKEFDRVWRPAANAVHTTELVLKNFGIFGSDVFIKSAKTRDYIEDMQPGTLTDDYKTAPLAVTVHDDGTVTLT